MPFLILFLEGAVAAAGAYFGAVVAKKILDDDNE